MRAGFVIVILTAGLLLGGCRNESAEQGRAAPTSDTGRPELVRALVPRRGTLEARLQITARVEALERADIIPKVEGIVMEIFADEGQDVVKGEILARIEDEEAANRVAAQELTLRQTKLAVSSSKLAAAEARSMLKAFEATLERESRELKRARGQHERGAIADKDLEMAEYAFNKALADKEQASLKVQRATEDVAKAELEALSAANALKAEKIKLSWTRLVATINGRLIKRNLRLGQKATLGAAAFTIADMDSLVVRTRVPETDLRVLKPGLRVHLEATAYPGKCYSGTVELIASEVDTTGGQIDVRIRLAPGNPPLRPGMFVSGHIVTEERQDTLLIPRKALLFDRDRPYLFVVEKKGDQLQARKVYIRRGLQNATEVEYLPVMGEEARIDDTTRIIVVGIDRLVDGAPIECEKESSPADDTHGSSSE